MPFASFTNDSEEVFWHFLWRRLAWRSYGEAGLLWKQQSWVCASCRALHLIWFYVFSSSLKEKCIFLCTEGKCRSLVRTMQYFTYFRVKTGKKNQTCCFLSENCPLYTVGLLEFYVIWLLKYSRKAKISYHLRILRISICLCLLSS